MKKPKILDARRSVQDVQAVIRRFMENLTIIFATVQYPPQLVFNIDETSLYVPEGRQPALAVPSTEPPPIAPPPLKLPNATAVMMVSSDGEAYPTTVVLSSATTSPEFSSITTHFLHFLPNRLGHLNATTFQIIFQETLLPAILSRKALIGKPYNHALLIMDAATIHNSEDVQKLCRDNLVDILFIPSHTSHRLQPLDRYVFGNLKNIFRQWDGEEMPRTEAEVRMMFGEKLKRAIHDVTVPDVVMASWRDTGLYPLSMQKALVDVPDVAPGWARKFGVSAGVDPAFAFGRFIAASDDLRDILPIQHH